MPQDTASTAHLTVPMAPGAAAATPAAAHLPAVPGDAGRGRHEAVTLAGSGRRVTCVSVQARVGPLALQLAPAHVPCVAALGHHVLQGSGHSCRDGGGTGAGNTGAACGVRQHSTRAAGVAPPHSRRSQASPVSQRGAIELQGLAEPAWEQGQAASSGSGRAREAAQGVGLGGGAVGGAGGWGGDANADVDVVKEVEDGGWGRSSLFADLMAPNYEDLVQHLLQPCLVRGASKCVRAHARVGVNVCTPCLTICTPAW